MKHRPTLAERIAAFITALIVAALMLAAPVSLVSCAGFAKADVTEYAIIAAEGALTLAQARLVAEAAKPGADPLKIAALQTAVLMAERALQKAKERLAAPPVLTSSK